MYRKAAINFPTHLQQTSTCEQVYNTVHCLLASIRLYNKPGKQSKQCVYIYKQTIALFSFEKCLLMRSLR